jgi:TolA-binding protein
VLPQAGDHTMRGLRAVAFLMLSLLIAGFIIPGRILGADAALKNIRFGKDKGAIRVVLDFEGQPSSRVSTHPNGDLFIELPMVSLDQLQRVLKATKNRYPGWIKEFNAVMDKGKPALKITLSKGVSLAHHGAVSNPDRLYFDFKKEEEGSIKPGDISLSGQKTPAVTRQSPKSAPVSPPENPRLEKSEKENSPTVEHPEAKEQPPAEPPSLPSVQTTPPNPRSNSPSPLNVESPGLSWKAPPQQAPGQRREEAVFPSSVPPEEKNYITKKIDPSAQSSNRDESDENLFNTALGCYEKKEFLRALDLLNKFMTAFPRSPLMDRAAYLRADCLYEVKRYAPIPEKQEVIDAFTDALSRYPNSDRAASGTLKMGIAYLEMGFSYEALAQFKLVESNFSGTPQAEIAPYWIAETVFQMGKYEEAIQLLTGFIRSYPNNNLIKRAMVRLGECYFRLNRDAEADQVMKEAFEKWPDAATELPPDSMITIAEQFRRQGRMNQAEELLLLGVNMYPEDEKASELLFRLAQTYAAQGDHNKAGAAYYLLMERYPESDEGMMAQLELADMGRKKIPLDSVAGKSEPYLNPQATYEFFAAEGTPRLREQALLKLAQSYQQSGELEKALEAYRWFAVDFPLSPQANQVQSEAVAILKELLNPLNPEKDSFAAVKLYETGFLPAGWKLDDPSCLLKLGECYAQLDLLKEAVEISQNALQKSAMDPGLQCRILERGAYWRFQSGRIDQAIEWLAKYVQQEPSGRPKPEHVFNLAGWKCYRKQYTDAVALYLRLVSPTDQKPDQWSARAAAELGKLYLKMNQPADAVTFLTKAVELYPGGESGGKNKEFLGACHLILADAYALQSSFPQAYEHYLQSLKFSLKQEDMLWASYQADFLEQKLGGGDGKSSYLEKLGDAKGASVWVQIGEAVIRHKQIKERSSKLL